MGARLFTLGTLGIALLFVGCESKPAPNPSMKFDPKEAYNKEKTQSPRPPETKEGEPGKAVAGAPAVKVSWIGTKPDGKHTGGFEKVTAKAEKVTPDLSTAQLSAEIDMTSLTSDDGKLTNHLKGGDFFLVEKHPTATFESKSIKAKKDGDNTHEVVGELTLKGVKSPITFPAKITVDKDTVTMSASFKLNRHNIGITYGKGKINDDVELKIDMNVPAGK